MTDFDPLWPLPPAMSPDPSGAAEASNPSQPPVVGAAELAAALAARLCHDFISPASAIVSGVDLLDDPTAADMRDDALNLIGASARKLVAHLAFSRVAFGASATADTFDARELRKLTEGVFAHMRADLDWRLETDTLCKPAARALLNMAQIAGAALPFGGAATVWAQVKDGATLIAVESAGARMRLRPEVERGLQGEPLGDGLTGHWVQAYYLHALLTEAGGRMEVQQGEGRLVIRARAPA